MADCCFAKADKHKPENLSVGQFSHYAIYFSRSDMLSDMICRVPGI